MNENTQRLRILYLEDSRADAELAQRALARRAPHATLEIVASVAEALSRLAAPEAYDLVLCDLSLPDGGGLEVLEHVRSRDLPLAVVILTSSGDQASAIAALQAGADDYLVKHGDYCDQLSHMLVAALARYRTAQLRKGRTLRVLYAEHNPFDADLSRIHLARHAPHIQLEVVASGEAVLARLAPGVGQPLPCDVVLLDFQLPGATALAIAKTLRDERGLDLPVVVVAAHGSEESVATALRVGVADYLVKGEGYLNGLPAALERAFQQAELARRQTALQTTTARLQHLLEASPVVLYAVRIDGEGAGLRFTPTWVSDNVTRLFGHPVVECLRRGWWTRNVHPDDGPAVLSAVDGLLASGSLATEYRFRDGSGALRWVRDEMRVLYGPQGRATEIVGSWSDITFQRHSEERLRLDAAALASTRDGVLITTLDGRIEAVNPAFTEISGYTESEVLGQNPRIFSSGRHDKAFYAALWQSVQAHGSWQGELWNRRKNGEIYPQLLTISTVRNPRGEPAHYVGVSTDLTRIKMSEAQLDHLAHYDPLTGLPNRLLLQSNLHHALERAERYAHGVGLLVINIDQFKTINESLGHTLGDELLRAVAHRLDGRLRGEDVLARIGGDEFSLVLESLADPVQAESVARGLLDSLEQAFTLSDGHETYLRASIGIAVYPGDGSSAVDLLRQADTAMHRAKEQGGHQIAFYTSAFNLRAIERLELETALRGALERGEFALHYQPKVDLASGRMVGAEALLRWHHPTQGLVPPLAFIPAAERSGLIVPIGAWVIDEACRQVREWHAAGFHEMKVAVNVSARQFGSGNLEAVVQAALERHAVAPAQLELELTESMLMEAPEIAIKRLAALKRVGIRLSLDDFGTGYSSLAYLSRFPVDYLKIDRSFVDCIASDPNAASISTSIIALAHRMGLRVIAEGVETEAQLAYLVRHGCDEMQGYHFSKPLPAAQFTALLHEGRCLPVTTAPEHARTLLLVDDEPNVLSAIRRSLRDDNYRILSARDANEGLDLLARNDVQVILSDQRMPGMSGTEFFGRVKILHPDTVRIVLSGYAELESIIQAVNTGAIYKILTKPWDGDQLRAQVRDAFSYHEAIVRPRSRLGAALAPA
jgi:diguanylate cyclase (GGDEF)-like protein/PAS domain S-box-containing protein